MVLAAALGPRRCGDPSGEGLEVGDGVIVAAEEGVDDAAAVAGQSVGVAIHRGITEGEGGFRLTGDGELEAEGTVVAGIEGLKLPGAAEVGQGFLDAAGLGVDEAPVEEGGGGIRGQLDGPGQLGEGEFRGPAVRRGRCGRWRG